MSALLQQLLESVEGAGPAPADAVSDRALRTSPRLTGVEAERIPLEGSDRRRPHRHLEPRPPGGLPDRDRRSDGVRRVVTA